MAVNVDRCASLIRHSHLIGQCLIGEVLRYIIIIKISLIITVAARSNGSHHSMVFASFCKLPGWLRLVEPYVII